MGFLNFPAQRTFANITLLTGTREYTLASGFIRFEDERPWFYLLDASDLPTSTIVLPYRGGEPALRKHDPQYRTTNGNPVFWYPSGTANNKVSFYQIPDSSHNNDKYGYFYVGNATLSATTDNLPFTLEEADEAFVMAAARRFLYFPNAVGTAIPLAPTGPDFDPIIRAARAQLRRLLSPTKPTSRYADRILV